ncbi:hypothetical protein SASPL_144310 [Salvia splendens]|uniref:GDSL esterase/lipase n=1 Tax=Salvia splendens TaxID=180675 RepID=A0A8X8WFH9_SALSN|nr:hypothetical protein SASPL_144310 [Salvia splendens]
MSGPNPHLFVSYLKILLNLNTPKLGYMKIVFFLVLSFSITILCSPLPKYDSIFSFGDSLADTGNFLLSGALKFPVIRQLPYGQTFFRHATGRCSDGRLIVRLYRYIHYGWRELLLLTQDSSTTATSDSSFGQTIL